MKKEMKRIISVAIVLLLVVTLINNQNVQAMQISMVKPNLQIITQPKEAYNQQDTISFKVQVPNYSGKVEYRVILYNGTTKATTNLWNSSKTGYYYRGWQPTGTYQFEIKWSASQLKAGAYSMTVLVRKANGKNSFDSYVDTKSFYVRDNLTTDSVDNNTGNNNPGTGNVNTYNVASVNDMVIDMYQYEKFDFPKKVITKQKDGSSKEVSVTWNSLNLDSNIPGVFDFEGTVQGYDKKVKMTVNIISKSLEGNTSGNINNKALWKENGEWVYTVNGSIEKMRSDGSDKSTINFLKAVNIQGSYSFRSIFIVDNYIYTMMGGYIRELEKNAGIYKLSLDGYQATVITNDNIGNMCVVGDWIYYYNKSDGYRLYKIKTDGTSKIKLDDDSTTLFLNNQKINVVGDWIYYTYRSEKVNNQVLYKIKIDGTNKTKLSDQIEYYDVTGGWIYYSYGMDIYKMRADGSEKTKFVEGYSLDFNVSGEWFYYCKWIAPNQFNLYKIKLDGTNNTKITNTLARDVNVIGDWIYFHGADQGTSYMIRTDGTGEQKISS